MKLIDFDDFENNSFHVCTELTYKNGDEEFILDKPFFEKMACLCSKNGLSYIKRTK